MIPDGINIKKARKEAERPRQSEAKLQMQFPMISAPISTPALEDEDFWKLVRHVYDEHKTPGFEPFEKIHRVVSERIRELHGHNLPAGECDIFPLRHFLNVADQQFVRALYDTMSTPVGEERDEKMDHLHKLRAEVADLYAESLMRCGSNEDFEQKRHRFLGMLEGTVTASVFNDMKALKLIDDDTRPSHLYERMPRDSLRQPPSKDLSEMRAFESDIRRRYTVLFTPRDMVQHSQNDQWPPLLERLQDTHHTPAYAVLEKIHDRAFGFPLAHTLLDEGERNFVKALLDTMQTAPGQQQNQKMRELQQLRDQLADFYVELMIERNMPVPNINEEKNIFRTLLSGPISENMFNHMASMKLMPEDMQAGKLYDRPGRPSIER